MSTRRERAKEPIVKMNKQLMEIEASNMRKQMERNISLWKSEIATDLAKLVFAGVVIGGIYQQEVDFRNLWQFGGLVLFIISLLVGYRYYKRGLKE